MNVWTAGQRVDSSGQSPFVWKPSDSWKEMKYTNWAPGDPNYFENNENYVILCGNSPDYQWCDLGYTEWVGFNKLCGLCEIDMV